MKSLHLLALAAVLAGESALFLVVTGHRDAWIYPRWNDQVQYLTEAYNGYEQAQKAGFAQGVRQTLTQGSAQGSLHGLLALLAFEAAGPSRIAALSLNLFAFLALQAATFLAARRATGSFPIAWASVALLAALRFPWSGGPASAIDFRLDWMAACAYGVALAVAIAGNGFRSRRWAVFFGIAVGALILTRFLTAVYVGLIYAAILVWFSLGTGRWRRCGNLALSGLVAIGIFGPIFWRDRRAILDYYWIGHFTGPERALRDSHFSLVHSVGWLFSDLLTRQLGAWAVALAIGAAGAFLALGAVRGLRAEAPPAPRRPLGSAWALAAVFLAAPAAVLVLHPEKASQAVSILIPGSVWIFVLSWARLSQRLKDGATAATCAAVALAGAVLFWGEEAGRRYPGPLVEEYRQVNALGDYLYFRAEEAGLAQPRVAVTWVMDSLGAGPLGITGYERHGRPMRFIDTLPTGLYATTHEAIMHGLADSDFVCLVTRAAVNWPFDRQMVGLVPEMRQWCDANLTHAGDLDAVEFSVSIYERPALARPGGGGGVVLGGLMRAASRGPAYARAVPPAPPIFAPPTNVLGSTRAEFRYTLAAAYSPVLYTALGLPEGLHLDPRTGEIRGWIARAGVFPARVSAANPAGSTLADLAFQVEEAGFFAVVSAPPKCAAREPVEIHFGAFDADGKLDFLDVADLSELRLIERIPAPVDQRQRWQGSYRLTFDRPGTRLVQFKFARFDGAKPEPYSFVNRNFTIEVVP